MKRHSEKAVKEGMSVGLNLKEAILREVEFVYANVIQEFLTQVRTLRIDSVVQ